MKERLNVLGEPLEPCSLKPLTGYYRDGTCFSGPDNPGVHAVCIYATEEFLAYSKQVGNDLSTPIPKYNFAGVKPGQSWCLSGPRFVQAHKDGMVPHIFIHATHERMLDLIDLDTLKQYAIDL
ncbi:DUF2237 family protein [Sulfurovum riftiae]|uniref:DUF2237 domain-containing protein n=1 Tax=Sulfurovum riftiae TaxID=1630136 RepID=A0A151CJJ1_9BACT|nr:DUF2237 domain-containing protein [Sulfurovum riftiae]KYJ87696.1 hypothetical protein AS592_11425 [Sulfurovum riftiae]